MTVLDVLLVVLLLIALDATAALAAAEAKRARSTIADASVGKRSCALSASDMSVISALTSTTGW
jgi:hypothetical protein